MLQASLLLDLKRRQPMQIIDPIEFGIGMPISVGEILINLRYDLLMRPAAVLFTNPADTVILSIHWTSKASQIVWDQAYNLAGLRHRHLPGVELEEFRSYLVRIALTCSVEKAVALKDQAIARLRPQYMSGTAEIQRE
jgi:hypothetical protein